MSSFNRILRIFTSLGNILCFPPDSSFRGRHQGWGTSSKRTRLRPLDCRSSSSKPLGFFKAWDVLLGGLGLVPEEGGLPIASSSQKGSKEGGGPWRQKCRLQNICLPHVQIDSRRNQNQQKLPFTHTHTHRLTKPANDK